MMYYAGLDVSMRETAICVVDEKRKVVKEGKVGSEPESIAAWLAETGLGLEHVCLARPGRWHRRCTRDWRLPDFGLYRELLPDLCRTMDDACICGLGQAAPNPIP